MKGQTLHPDDPVHRTIKWWHPSPTSMRYHEARAVVLNRWFDPVEMTYTALDVRYNIIDADTLEPIAEAIAAERSQEFRRQNNLTPTDLLIVRAASRQGRLPYPER